MLYLLSLLSCLLAAPTSQRPSNNTSTLLAALAQHKQSVLCIGDSFSLAFLQALGQSLQAYDGGVPVRVASSSSLSPSTSASSSRVAKSKPAPSQGAFFASPTQDCTPQLFQRLPVELYRELRRSARPATTTTIPIPAVGLVIISAGKSDLHYAKKRSAVQILSHIVSLHEVALGATAAGVHHTIAITIPSCSLVQSSSSVWGSKDLVADEQRRLLINRGIRTYAARSNGRVLLLDLSGAEEATVRLDGQQQCNFSPRIAARVLKLLQETNIQIIEQQQQQQQLALCQEYSAHRQGNWHFSPARPSAKTFVCCGGGSPLNSTRGHLDVDDVKPGTCSLDHTLPLAVQRGLSLPLNAACGDDCCACDREDGTRYSVSVREQWEWRPGSCRLVEWSATAFCQALRGRKLLLVGDSTMQQAFSTLTSMISAGGGDCATDVFFGISSHLETSPPPFKSKPTDYIRQLRPDIVVLNVGAHLKDMGDIQIIFDLLEASMARLRKQATEAANAFPLPTIIWRSQFPGHIMCERQPFPLPFLYRDAPEDVQKFDKYHWRLFRRFDEYSRNRTAELGWHFLDASPLYYRPDGHVIKAKWVTGVSKKSPDCLHYCTPGPLNLFSQLLLHLLRVRSI